MEHQTRKRPSATTILKEIKQTLSLADICAKLGELNETLKRQ